MKKGILPACNAIPPPLELSRPCKRRAGRKILSTTGNTVMKREAWPFHNRYIFSTPYMAPEPHIAFPHCRFTTVPKRLPPTGGDALQEKALCRQFFLFYRKKGSKASSIGSCSTAPLPYPHGTPCYPAEPSPSRVFRRAAFPSRSCRYSKICKSSSGLNILEHAASSCSWAPRQRI